VPRKSRTPVRQKRPERGPTSPILAGDTADRVEARDDGARPRIACILIPLFPLAARLRCESELQKEGLAIFEGDGHQARVVAATRPRGRPECAPA
jgi:hypothetical protein